MLIFVIAILEFKDVVGLGNFDVIFEVIFEDLVVNVVTTVVDLVPSDIICWH